MTHDGRQLRAMETQLHHRILERDQSALLECFDRLADVVYCASLWEAGDPVAAEEATERAFVELWARPHDFDPGRGPLVLQLVAVVRRSSSP